MRCMSTQSETESVCGPQKRVGLRAPFRPPGDSTQLKGSSGPTLHLNCEVVAVIHQPRYETLQLFDDLVLLGPERGPLD